MVFPFRYAALDVGLGAFRKLSGIPVLVTEIQ